MASDNVGHVKGFPSALEDIEETGIEGWALDVENLGIFGIDIT